MVSYPVKMVKECLNNSGIREKNKPLEEIRGNSIELNNFKNKNLEVEVQVKEHC